ncbi:MAG: hypothetical protein AAF756_06615 [Pseudomonadota bacterium]
MLAISNVFTEVPSNVTSLQRDLQVVLLGTLFLVTADVLAQSESVSPEAGYDTTTANRECVELTADRQSLYSDFDFLGDRKDAGLKGTETISSIVFLRQNVFPDADHLLARVTNRFNIVTRESTLRAALPFAVGDRVTNEELEEAERILRRTRFLYDARVIVQKRCADGISLAVIVRDVWTLTPSLGFARAGGDNQTDFGITESNLLGLGKALSLSYQSDQDRAGVQFSYSDPNIAGTRWTANLTATSNDDGEVFGARVERPFFALDTTWATGAAFSSVTREQPLEFLSETLFDIDVERQTAEAFIGTSRGRVQGWVDRFSFGFAFDDERYEFPSDFPGDQLVERRFAYPFLAWQRIEDRFVRGENLQRVERTEDLNLGLRTYARVGWSTDAFGGDESTLLYSAGASKRWYLTESQLVGFCAGLSGRYDLDSGRGTEDFISRAELDYLLRSNSRIGLYARLRLNFTRDLDPESQLTLGGDTDLRGYPSRYQPGDRSYLATLEQRYYSDWSPFGLFRVGFAAFVDVGRAWFGETAPEWVPERSGDHFGTLSNVGLGLRLESIRTRRDRVLHIDLAHPLVDGPGVDSFQLVLTAKRSL